MKSLGLWLGAVVWSWVCFAQNPEDVDVFNQPEKTPAAAPSGVTKKKSVVETVETDRFVLEVRQSNPTTAEELINSVRLLSTYGRTDESQKYLQKLVDLNSSTDELAALQRRFGSGLFFRWGRDSTLAPLGAEYSKKVLDAAMAYTRDPERLEGLVNQLSNPNVELRRQALADLRAAGEFAFAPLFKALADPQRGDDHRFLRGAMSQIGSPLAEPLVAALDSSNEPFRTQIVEVLSGMSDLPTVQYLVFDSVSPTASERARTAARGALERLTGSRHSSADAEKYLRDKAHRYFLGKIVIDTDQDDLSTIWIWDDGQLSLTSFKVLHSDGALIAAGRLAKMLRELRPENVEYRRLFLMAKLESAKVLAGIDQPLPRGSGTEFDRAAKEGMEAVEDALIHALKMERSVAATACAEVLGAVGTIELVKSRDGQPRALVRAITHSDRRLRFAAAEAILEINPSEPFAGSSRVPEALAFFIANIGERRAIIGHPRTEQAQTLAGMLTELGFSADSGTTGRRVYQQAISRSDIEFVLLSDALENPRVEDVIGSLRADPKTAGLPIGIMAREERYAQMEQFAAREINVVVLPRPTEIATLAREVARMSGLVGRTGVGLEERIRQAQAAFAHFARLGQDPGQYAFYDLMRHEGEVTLAADTPELTEAACGALGQFGTARAQRGLLAIINQNGLSLDIRRAAANGLTAAIERRGIMLTRDEIQRQYQIYNSSQYTAIENQQILSAALDAIELPHRRRLAGRVRFESDTLPDLQLNSAETAK